jgi:hypothetical protein
MKTDHGKVEVAIQQTIFHFFMGLKNSDLDL